MQIISHFYDSFLLELMNLSLFLIKNVFYINI